MFVGITIHTLYGTSGNELPPPAINCFKKAELIDAGTFEEAMAVMAEKVLPMRRAADKICEPYSSPDGYDWEVIKLFGKG